MGGMSIWHWLIVGVVVMLLFGKGRFSEFMGDAAKGIKNFKKGMAEADDDEQPVRRPAARLQAQAPLEPASERDLQPMKDDRPGQS